jgi:ABC-2 type transport system ATP-binding protein
VTGPDLPALAERLRQTQAVEQVAAFGNALHVTGSDREALKATIAPMMDEADRGWREVAPGLEDVFIHLMHDSNDAPAEAAATAISRPKTDAR